MTSVTRPLLWHGRLASKPKRSLARCARQTIAGAATRMVERHYGHLAPSFIADAVRKRAPKFGFKPDTKIAPLVPR